MRWGSNVDVVRLNRISTNFCLFSFFQGSLFGFNNFSNNFLLAVVGCVSGHLTLHSSRLFNQSSALSMPFTNLALFAWAIKLRSTFSHARIIFAIFSTFFWALVTYTFCFIFYFNPIFLR